MTPAGATVGTPAPDFSLPSTAGSDVVLSAYRGESNVLLAFFPLAFTGVCTSEMCDFTADLSQFARADTTVFGISVDSVPVLREFKRKHQISVELLSDFKRDVSRMYGILIEEAFFSKRAYYIIDREGILRWSFVEATIDDRRGNAELLERLRALSQRDEGT